jgi:hypothetical protein
VLLFVVLALLVVASMSAGAVSEREEGMATFEGRIIDLRDGWGDARACLVSDTTDLAQCFRSEAELLSAVDADLNSADDVGFAAMAASACSSSLRLYDGTNYSGAVLYLTTRTSWINLSSYGFSNRTSSFKVGACFSYLADLSNGGGDWYATSATTAWKVAPTMASGWNNRVSSVYIG